MSFLEFVIANRDEVLRLTFQHLGLVAASTGIAMVIGVPAGIALAGNARLRTPVLGLANVFQAIPSLALFGFLIPLPFIGGIGARTAIVALVVYALLPIVRNTYTGLAGIDPAVRDAARGLGMTDWQRLRMIEFPLAIPVILAGVRVATVIGVGIATIAAWPARFPPRCWRCCSTALCTCWNAAWIGEGIERRPDAFRHAPAAGSRADNRVWGARGPPHDLLEELHGIHPAR